MTPGGHRMYREQVGGSVAPRAARAKNCKRWFALVVTSIGFFVLLCAQLWAANGGSVSGTVKDASGGAIPKVGVIIRNLATGVQQNATTNDEGFYAFPTLDVGSYEIAIVFPGFKPYKRTGLVIDVGTKLEVDVPLELGEQSQQVTVSDTGLHVETESSQMGEVLASTQIEGVPLNGRAFTDLLGLQPGVVPISTGAQNQIVMAGLTNTPPSGDSNPGNQSINGQKENANGFSVNGSNVEEAVNMGVALLPNLDSISEFRVLTNNFDAEHGNYMGGQIVVATKSGTNQIHGDAFEFARNTALDSKPFFSLTKAEFDQNQFGGTVGGPIKQNKILALVRGRIIRERETTGVPILESRAFRRSLIGPATCSIWQALSPAPLAPPYMASQLSSRLGYAVTSGEAYYNPGCASDRFKSSLRAISGGGDPAECLGCAREILVAVHPVRRISAPNEFDSTSLDQIVRDDKGGARLDANTHYGNFFVYYTGDNYFLNNPYPATPGRGECSQRTGRLVQCPLGRFCATH